MSSSAGTDPEKIKARIKASYDVIAPTYNAWTLNHTTRKLEYLSLLLSRLNIPPKSSTAGVPSSSPRLVHFLELGCGAGLPVTERLLQEVPHARIVANDFSSTQIQLGKAALGEHGEKAGQQSMDSRVDWIEGDMMALAFPDGSAGPDGAAGGLDAVLAFYSIIHLTLADQAELITRIARWLRPGGYFLANFAEEAMPGVVMEHWLHEQGWMFWSGWGVEQTQAKVREAGLDILVGRVEKDDVDANFLWILAQKPEN